MLRSGIVSLIIVLALAGCATPATPPSRCGYRTGTPEETHFKGLGDEGCLALYRRVLEKNVNTGFDSVAKEITVTAFRRALKARGVTAQETATWSAERDFHEVRLKKWETERLVGEYELIGKALREKQVQHDGEKPRAVDLSGRVFWSFDNTTAPAIKEDETLRVIRLTALCAIGNELSRRDRSSALWSTAGYAAAEFTGVAARIAVMIASFMI
jgi:hypothetical protein